MKSRGAKKTPGIPREDLTSTFPDGEGPLLQANANRNHEMIRLGEDVLRLNEGTEWNRVRAEPRYHVETAPCIAVTVFGLGKYVRKARP